MKYNSLFIAFLSLIITTSCTNNPNTIKVIPKNAQVVTVFNIPSLIQKGDIFNLYNLEIIQKLKKSQNLKVEEAKLIENILENPLTIGLNYDKDWFSFYIQESGDEHFFCFSAAIEDENSLTNFIEDFLETAKLELKIKEVKNYKYILTDSRTVCAWDKEKILIISAENYTSNESNLNSKVKELFNLESNSQLIVNDSFEDFYKSKKDVSVWLSSNILSESREYKELEEDYDFDASNNYLSFFLVFKNGQIDLNAKFDGNEKIEKLIEDNKILNDDFNTDLLDYFPSVNIGFISLCINTDEIYEQIKSNSIVSMGSMSKVTPQEFLENMGGSIAMTVYDFKQNENSNISDIRPLAALAFDVKSKDLLEELMSILPKGSFDQKEGYYEITTGRRFNENIYLAFNNDACLLTNHKPLIINFKDNKTLSNNLNETSIASAIGDNTLYIEIKYNDDKLSKGVKKLIDDNQTNSEKEMVKVLKQLVESIDFKVSKKNTAGISLKLKNKADNSLKVIIKTLDENAEQIEANASDLSY